MHFFHLHMEITGVFHFLGRPAYRNYETKSFRREAFFYGHNRRHDIAIACHQDSGIKIVIIGALKKFDRLLGLDMIKAVHFNDSLSPAGSHVDRHQHLGKGKIGLEALSRIISHPKLKNAAFIMETPKESDKDDKRNIAIARKMCKKI